MSYFLGNIGENASIVKVPPFVQDLKIDYLSEYSIRNVYETIEDSPTRVELLTTRYLDIIARKPVFDENEDIWIFEIDNSNTDSIYQGTLTNITTFYDGGGRVVNEQTWSEYVTSVANDFESQVFMLVNNGRYIKETIYGDEITSTESWPDGKDQTLNLKRDFPSAGTSFVDEVYNSIDWLQILSDNAKKDNIYTSKEQLQGTGSLVRVDEFGDMQVTWKSGKI